MARRLVVWLVGQLLGLVSQSYMLWVCQTVSDLFEYLLVCLAHESMQSGWALSERASDCHAFGRPGLHARYTDALNVCSVLPEMAG